MAAIGKHAGDQGDQGDQEDQGDTDGGLFEFVFSFGGGVPLVTTVPLVSLVPCI
jgi:hypothetical protein